MTDISEFIARAHAYCSSRKVSPSTLSRKLLGNGNRLGELEAGKSLRVDTLLKAQKILSEMERAPKITPIAEQTPNQAAA